MRGFIVIPGFAYDYDLTLTELVIFGAIYGFSKDGKSYFTGTRKYLVSISRSSIATVDRALKKLIDMNLIEREYYHEHGMRFSKYRSKIECYEEEEPNYHSDSTPITVITPSSQCDTDNIDILSYNKPYTVLYDKDHKEHIEDNKDYIEHIEDIKEHTETYKDHISHSKKARFVKPSVEEVQAYIDEKGYHFDAESFVAFYESKDWYVGKNKMTSWKSCCVTWEKRHKADEKAKRKLVGNEEYYEMVKRWANDEE